MGALFHLTGRDPTAFYEKGLAIRLRLFAEHPDNPRYAAAAAGGYLNLGLCYQWSRQLEKAEEVYRNAQALLEPLIREHPEEPRYASLLASALTNWGMLLKDTGRPEESLDRYTRAVGVAEAIVRNEPNYVTARLDLLSAHGGRAQANTALKRFDDALGDWDRVIELSDETSRPGYRVSRAFVSILAGDHGRATAEAEALAQEAAISGDTLYNAACLFARSSALAASDTILDATEQAAIADRYAARAMELLRSLHASGYFDDAARATTLRQDTDLNTLRGREDFRGLQNEVR
jgi:tetratricopeptide (TPR) repeat protein